MKQPCPPEGDRLLFSSLRLKKEVGKGTFPKVRNLPANHLFNKSIIAYTYFIKSDY
jgi:hypothetical protein